MRALFNKLWNQVSRKWMVIGVIVLLLLGISLFYVADMGKKVGKTTGTVVGRANGSYSGITRGRSEGYYAGKEAGLSAEDTKAAIENNFLAESNLEVLLVDQNIVNVHTLGKDYAAIYSTKASAVFTVDLQKAKIISDESDSQSNFRIEVPEPRVDLYIDDTSVQKLAEYQKNKYAGNAQDGYTAYMNTMEQAKEKTLEELSADDNLMTQARESARRQIEILAKAVCKNEAIVSVSFFNEE